jgi:MraZ protein
MLFTGTHPITLDHEDHFAAPASYREELTSGAYIVQGFERNLIVFPSPAFEQVYRALRTQNLADPLARSLLRMVLGSAHEISLDGDGRMALPDDLKEFAQVTEQMMLIGQGDFFEVWQPDLWEEQESQLRDAAANSNRFSSLSLTIR